VNVIESCGYFKKYAVCYGQAIPVPLLVSCNNNGIWYPSQDIQAPDPFAFFSASIRCLKMMPTRMETMMMAKMVTIHDITEWKRSEVLRESGARVNPL